VLVSNLAAVFAFASAGLAGLDVDLTK